jgi:hypothetical protein
MCEEGASKQVRGDTEDVPERSYRRYGFFRQRYVDMGNRQERSGSRPCDFVWSEIMIESGKKYPYADLRRTRALRQSQCRDEHQRD